LKEEEENKSDNTPEEKKQSTDENEDDEMKKINLIAKSVNIRFGNYSMLMRASQLGISSKLLAMLGMGSSYQSKTNKPVLDAGEEAMLS